MTSRLVDRPIQAYLRAVALVTYETRRVGPFQVGVSPQTDNPYLNYAIPDDGARPSRPEVDALVEAYRAAGRRPRLEYLPTAVPAVELALLNAGFTVQGRLPVMVCRLGAERGSVPGLEAPAGVELLLPRTDSELLGLATAQNESFGEMGTPGPEDAQRMRRSIVDGLIAVLARDTATGEAIGGGVCTVPIGGITVFAGIGVREAFRGRGIGAALTSRLTREAFAAGVTTAFLTPGHDATERIYARAGYVTVGEILHIWH